MPVRPAGGRGDPGKGCGDACDRRSEGGSDWGWEVPAGPPVARHNAVLFVGESMNGRTCDSETWFDISRDSSIRERKIEKIEIDA